jgi:hypothetical protein
VLVTTTYTISPDKEERFLWAMTSLRRARLRTGAMRWGLFRDGEKPDRFIELFAVPTWDEHLRQHRNRLTASDWALEEEANGFSDPKPETRHLLGV